MKRSSRWGLGLKSTGFFMKTQKELAPSSLIRPRNLGAQRKLYQGDTDSEEECVQVAISPNPTLRTKLWLFMTPKQSPAMWCFSSSLAVQVQDLRMQIFGLIHDWVWEEKKNYSKIVPQVSEIIQQDHHREEQACPHVASVPLALTLCSAAELSIVSSAPSVKECCL